MTNPKIQEIVDKYKQESDERYNSIFGTYKLAVQLRDNLSIIAGPLVMGDERLTEEERVQRIEELNKEIKGFAGLLRSIETEKEEFVEKIRKLTE